MIDLIGHSNLLNFFNLLKKNNKFPNKILLSGKEGIGKFLFIKKFLFEIHNNLENNEILLNANTHPNIFYINKQNEKKNIEISQIREMINFINHSSFNNPYKYIIIDNIEYLNESSSNALLKSLEDSGQNCFFILILNSERKIHKTIKSRCVEFKMYLTENERKLILENIFDKINYSILPNEFKNVYLSPKFIILFYNFVNEIKYDLNNFNINNFFNYIIDNKLFNKFSFLKENLNDLVEIFFYKNLHFVTNYPIDYSQYFYKKLSNVKRYNLDYDTFFIEFKERLLKSE